MPDATGIAVTGLGVVSPIGFGRAAFWEGLAAGRSGIRPISLFDADGDVAGEVPDFDPKGYLGPKGLRLFDRTTLLALCATQLALEDAGLAMSEDLGARTGVVLSSTCGSPASRSAFYLDALEDGIRRLNPALFPNTVVNSPASQIAIRFGIRGFSCTISSGFTGGIEALAYGARALRLGRADAVLVGGVEELCALTYQSFRKVGYLAGPRRGSPPVCAPFDRRRNGAVLGEGAAVLVLERLEDARDRQAPVYAVYRGAGMATDATRYGKSGRDIAAPIQALQRALQHSGLTPDAIDCVLCGANASVLGDLIEARTLQSVLGDHVTASACKAMLGESFSASALFQAGAALLCLTQQIVPPTVGVESVDARCSVRIAGTAQPREVNAALVSAFGPQGYHAACAFSRCA